MGKVKKGRQRLHAKAAKLEKNRTVENADVQDVDMDNKTALEPIALGGENLFSGLNIDLGKVTTKLPDDLDARSTITSKTLKGMNLKKKDKRKLRHDLWLKKMDVIQTAKKDAKDKQKREKTVVVGDMKPLDDTLPTLELLLKTNPQADCQKNRQLKYKPIKKKKQQVKDMLSNISVFKQVYNHPAFRANPSAIIQEHLINKLKQEQQEMDT